ncbi:hypothetical protein D3C75_996040 [compost metagenome]
MGFYPAGDIMNIQSSVAGIHIKACLQAARINRAVAGLHLYTQILRKCNVQIRITAVNSKMDIRQPVGLQIQLQHERIAVF